MNEDQYILVTNKTILQSISNLAAGLLSDESGKWGLTDKQRAAIQSTAFNASEKCFKKIKTHPDCSTSTQTK